MSQVKIITDGNFDSEVLKSPLPVLVDFTASWCGPCKALSPVLDTMAAERQDIKIVKIDVGGDADTAQTNPLSSEAYVVEAFPTLYLFRNGKVADRAIEALSKKSLSNWIDKTLIKPVEGDLTPAQNRTILQEQSDKAKRASRKWGLAWQSFKVASGVTLAAVGATPLSITFGVAVAGLSLANIGLQLAGKPGLTAIFGHKARPWIGLVQGAATVGAGFLMDSAISSSTGLLPSVIEHAMQYSLLVTGSPAVLGSALTGIGQWRQGRAKTAETENCPDGVCKVPPPAAPG